MQSTIWKPPTTPFKIRNLGLSGTSVAVTVGGIALTSASGNAQPLKTLAGNLSSLSVINQSGANAFVQLFNAQSGSGATVTFTVSTVLGLTGVITGVTATPVAGGLGYPPSATFLLPVTGGGGTGALVQATTNASGVVTSVAVTNFGGSGYSNTTGAATAGITLGTTTPDYELYVPSSLVQVEATLTPFGKPFTTALTIAATTLEGGSVAPIAGIMVTGDFV